MSWRRYLPVGVFVLVLVSLHLLVTAADVPFYLTQLTMALYYALVAAGLCLLMGYAGQISMGHAGFFGIGAYLQAFLATADFSGLKGTPLVGLLNSLGLLIPGQDLYGGELLTLSPWIALLIVLGVTVIIAFCIGIPVLKLKGHYLAMATLGFAIIVHELVVGIDVFGGADGISGVPPFSLLPGVSVSGDMDARVLNYYIAGAVLVAGIVVALHIIHSRVGRALRAIHGNQTAASSLGINASRYKLATFVLSAVFAAVGGAFLVHFNAAIGPTDIDIMKSVRFVAVVAVGGMDNLWGVVYFGILLNFISLRQVFGSFDDIFFGVILIVIMLFLPRGLIRSFYFTRIKDLLARGYRFVLARLGGAGGSQ